MNVTFLLKKAIIFNLKNKNIILYYFHIKSVSQFLLVKCLLAYLIWPFFQVV